MFSCTKNYKVKLKGRSQVEYIEKSRRLILECETLEGDYDLVIYFDSVKEWANGGALLTVDEKSQIKKNIENSFKDKKILVDWA